MKLEEKTISSKTIFKGRIITVKEDIVELENGNKASREIVEHNGGVCILPLTNKKTVLLVEQYRYPYHQVVLEAPAGKLELNEDPLECGKRELLEEAGVIANNYFDLGKYYPTTGYVNEIIYLYIASDLVFDKQKLDEDEFLEIVEISLEKAYQMVMDNQIKDGKTQVAILKCKALLEQGLL